MPAAKKAQAIGIEHEPLGIYGPFDKISEPGCFVLNMTGDLIRVPEDALVAGRSPTIDVVSKEPWLVTKISNDPYLPLRTARTAAADMDLLVNF